jgi:hypothetical protein
VVVDAATLVAGEASRSFEQAAATSSVSTTAPRRR